MFEDLTTQRSTAIVEIVIMLLVAFILGFILAWILKRSKNSSFAAIHDNSEIDRLKENNRSLSASKIRLEADITDYQNKLKVCEIEKDEMKKKSELSPAGVVAEGVNENDAENARKLGFRAVNANQKDDLTKISGIGPFIEKKLNGLGIYTFEQISEFTPDTIDKVTKAIEFFPGRIQRDNWVKQANDLK